MKDAEDETNGMESFLQFWYAATIVVLATSENDLADPRVAQRARGS